MKKTIAFLISSFIILSVRTQVTSKEADSIFLQLAKSKPDSNRVGIFIQLAKYYFGEVSLANHMDSVEFYLKQARRQNQGSHSINFQNQINILSAKHYCAQHPGEDAKKVFLPVIDTCKKTGDISNETEAWFELAGIGNDAASIPFKITCSQNAMALTRQMHDIKSEMECLRRIADLHLQQHKFDMAESELLQILK